ncbi:PQQ-binding-like beta-propeller repeat protein [Alkalicaulis satelles]|uniref:Outer membrane protein assembly factor BamB n=1 Tax=Alkalicaulis satelles TaxID=2609175 RepID=A0A5M6ZRB9_9PROT|nr:PQQ-binding-like beta-propeller repeat protein [Alkalicaulis satelles]KAA5804831.1 PQQ-binding-like beta-propeller repeat protein [Alkalicaulis satelles]
MSLGKFFPLALALCAGLALSGCGAGERLSSINPFSGGDREDPNAPPRDQRVPVLQLDDRLVAPETAGTVNLPRSYVNSAWPQSDGFPTHAMQHTRASGALERLWRVDIGSGSSRDRRVRARPVITDGVVYAMDAEGRVSARDLDTGSERWRKHVRDDRSASAGGSWVPFTGGSGHPPTFGGSIGYDSGRIFAHTGGRFLVALDASTGEELWRRRALTPYHSAPTISEGRVLVTTDDNELLALDASNGEVMWSHRSIAETARVLATPSPAVLGETVIAPYSSGEVAALRAPNGRELWTEALTRAGGLTPMSSINDIAASPVILGDRVYAMSHSGVMAALDLRTGERSWTLPAGGVHTPAVAGDYIFLVTTEAQLVAINRHEGEVVWLTQLRQFENERRRRNRVAWAGPVLAGDRLVLASSQGELAIVDASNGEITATRNLGDPVFAAPVIAAETVVVVTNNGRLIALR